MAEEIISQLKSIGNEVQILIRNFKKDSPARKNNVGYFEERLKKLLDLVEKFDDLNSTVEMMDVPKDHDYISQDYFNNICDVAKEYELIFKQELDKLKAKSMSAPQPLQRHEPGPSTSQAEQSNVLNMATSQSNGLVRRFTAKMATIERCLARTTDDSIQQSANSLQYKGETLHNNWQQLEELYDSLWDQYEDPIAKGADLKQYVELERRVQDEFIKISTYADPSPNYTNVPMSIPLPKLEIPKFDGHYLKWTQFFDIFSHMVDKQQIPKVQKMYYLKSNVSGEAERLINHLSVTEENYTTAWTLLQERYSNKRVLTSSLIQKILQQPACTGSASSIKHFHDTTQECLLALNNLGIDTSAWDALLLQLLIKKLDQNTHMRYEQSISNPKELQSVQDFLSFLEVHFYSIEAVGFKDKHTAQSFPKSCASVVFNKKSNNTCKNCNNGAHPLFACKGFLSNTPSERLKFVQKHKLCHNCLKAGHVAVQCASRNCTKCDKKHNTLLHFDQVSSSIVSTVSDNSNGSSPSVLTASVINEAYILLGTVKVKVATANKTFIECRAILDSGSQINLVTEKLARKLNLDINLTPISIEGIGQRSKQCRGYISTTMKSLVNVYDSKFKAFVMSRIVTQQPTQKIDISSWNIPSNIKLADPEFHVPGDIDLLIGAEFYHNLLLEGKIQLDDHLPVLQNTVFGWMCCGRIHDMPQATLTCGILEKDDKALDSILTRFWHLDDVQTNTSNLTVAERNCEDFYNQTTMQDPNGRFIVRLPFCVKPENLGESLQMATNRFYSLEQRLLKQPKLKEMYIEFMREYERLGHMIKFDQKALTKPYYVIPHHCVLKPDSTTTKLRVVFDASAKTSSGLSLNEIMYKGPVVQSELSSILLRFRKHRFVFTTDIEKMYRQILVHPDDQQYQIILWRENMTDQLQFYKLTTVTYGTRTAPYLSTRCLQRIAHENKHILPIGAAALDNDFYVDDGLSGSDSITEAIEIKTQLEKMLSSTGFKLRKWCSNTARLLEGIPPQDQEVDLNFDDESTKGYVKTLGLIWRPKTDEFCIKVNQDYNQSITKRVVVSELARVYDPLGLVAPVIVKAKIFIQSLWQSNVDWDDKVSKTQHNEWIKFRENLKMLNDVRIPRHAFNHKSTTGNIQLHIFTDASERAYGAAVYIRSKNKDGTTSVHLLCSKSRVAPLKTQTIPRLELCAALLGAELATRVKQDLNYHHVILHMWTDSEIVLKWINSEPASYQTFVAHRIAKIQELTSVQHWRHVGSKDNPADLVSRGMDPSDIKQSIIWWYGPLFLHGQESCWPAKFQSKLSICDNLERKACTTAIATTVKDNLSNMIYSIKHNGSFTRLQRTVAYILRFINNIQKQGYKSRNTLSTTEIDNALLIIVKAMQEADFAAELHQLKSGHELKSNNPIASLSPFVDSHGVIPVGGRLQAAKLPFDARHPILLPYNDSIAKMIMHHLHINNFHCGPQALLAQTRQRFWPIKGKVMARSVVQHCVRCARSHPQMLKQIMGNLPADRVQLERPFLNAGVDFCGPIWIHYKIRGKRPCKAYIAVFCCFATKAVHLELVSDLTTNAFIGALNRFVYRRGRCQRLYCDNATNFVGAKNQLSLLEHCIYSDQAKEQIHNVCTTKGIDFQFIPPRAPHFGGLWEAAVKSAKHLLVRGIGDASLTYEELETVIVQIEGILNSRPLTPMSSSPDDLAALTPGHFLIGEPITAHPSPNATEKDGSLLQRWRLVHHLKEEFWSRWTKEYLNELQCRTKWRTQSTNVEPGTMVIIKEDNVPSLHWPLGRITKTFEGPDGCVRVAEVRTASGIIKRALNRLAPLFPEQQKKLPQEKTDEAQMHTHIPHKKPRLMSSNITLTIIAMFLCLPIVLGNSIEVFKVANEPGIHFENIGKNHIITTHWNLLIYYDLDPLKMEINALNKGTAIFQQICRQLRHDHCTSLVAQFSQIKDDLESDNRILLQKRMRRGLINGVGNVANVLFGVLDSGYAEKMSQTIQGISENESHLIDLIKNQTSIIDSTINIIKVDQEAVKHKFDTLDKSLDILKSHVIHIAKDQQLSQSLFSVALQLIMTAANLRRIQTTMLNVLTDVYHGQIGPLLLSPKQLQDEIIKIKAHLPSSIRLPAQQEDLLSLYKLMSVESGLTQNHVLFQIKLPLIESHDFNMYRIIPIPTLINGSLISLKPTTEILAITAHGDKYYPMTHQQYDKCMKVGQQTFLCPYTQSIYNKGAKNNACEVNLFNNETKLSCEVMEVPHSQWIQLTTKNRWIFSLKQAIKITAVCGKETHQATLEDAGILQMEPDCIIKNELFTLLGHQTIESVVLGSITTHGQWSYLENPKTAERVLLENAVEPYNIELKELMTLKQMLKDQQILELPNKLYSNNYHFLGVGYTALALGIIITMYLLLVKIKRRKYKPNIAADTPRPTPINTEFAIHV